MESPTYSSSSISNALANKSKEAFGVDPSASFEVSDVQNHVAQLTYTVTASYDYRVVGAPVTNAMGGLFTPEMANTLVHNRGNELLLNAGNTFRERVLNALKAKPQLFKRGDKFTLYKDQSYFSSIERCHPCGGEGSVTCYKCNGRSTHLCEKCSGRLKENCTGCWGSGWATPNCLQCGSSGNYAGQVCPVCHGSGKPTIRCYTCHGDKVMPCQQCSGRGQQKCGNCHSGQVTCDTCYGARTLIYAYHVEIDVSTSVTYGWKDAPGWMSDVINNAVNSGPDDIFIVNKYATEVTDPYKIVGLGHVVGGEATVKHNGASGNCRFIGEKHHAVFLDGILSGAFKSALDGVAKAEDIKAVGKASKTQIAATLVKEVEYGTATAKSSSPVRKGIITADQAAAFLNGRAACKEFITNKSKHFSVAQVLRFTGKIFVPLFVFYFLLNMFALLTPDPSAIMPGHLGLSALSKEFEKVVEVFFYVPRYLWMSISEHYNPIPLLVYAVLGWIVARCFGPVLFPIAWKRTMNGVLALYGILLMSSFMALYPTAAYIFEISDLLDLWKRGRFAYALSLTVALSPQILSISLLIAVARYKTAGVHWSTRMFSKLSVQ